MTCVSLARDSLGFDFFGDFWSMGPKLFCSLKNLFSCLPAQMILALFPHLLPGISIFSTLWKLSKAFTLPFDSCSECTMIKYLIGTPTLIFLKLLLFLNANLIFFFSFDAESGFLSFCASSLFRASTFSGE